VSLHNGIKILYNQIISELYNMARQLMTILFIIFCLVIVWALLREREDKEGFEQVKGIRSIPMNDCNSLCEGMYGPLAALGRGSDVSQAQNLVEKCKLTCRYNHHYLPTGY
jgi:hypothetical protein